MDRDLRERGEPGDMEPEGEEGDSEEEAALTLRRLVELARRMVMLREIGVVVIP